MKRVKFMLSAVMIALLCATGSASAKETTKYTGTVYGHPVIHLMPLGNGDGIVIVEITGIVALSGNPPTVNTLSCSGMGLQKVNNNITTNFYCNVKENTEDSFDIKGLASEINGKSSGSFDVVGGSGKWSGATGKGKFLRVLQTEAGNKTVMEMSITVP
jgi:hypothetical protein